MTDLPLIKYSRDSYTISTDKSLLDVDAIHDYLSNESYWSPGIPRQVVERAIAGSLCFGMYCAGAQVGYARVISDFATFAYLLDVYILKEHRGRGLGKWLVESILGYPELRHIRGWMLSTWDAHGLYEKYGFKTLEHPEFVMSRRNPEAFSQFMALMDTP